MSEKPLERRAWEAAAHLEAGGLADDWIAKLLRDCGDAILGYKDASGLLPGQRQKACTAAALPVPPDLADLRRLTMREVRALVGLSESAIRERIKAGTFPAPDFVDGPRCTRWSAGAVRRWLGGSMKVTSQEGNAP